MPLKEMWLKRQKVQNHFWERWQAEYLQALSIEPRSKHDNLSVKPGDVVLLKPDTLEKNQWRLARVVSVQSNQDGVVATPTVWQPL